jgi:pimeloyl-ACP methyl ester carboxylesterase
MNPRHPSTSCSDDDSRDYTDDLMAELPKPLSGTLHRYSVAPEHLAFISGHADLHVVLLGGMGDGLQSLPYAPLLAERCAALSTRPWALVQANLKSCYEAWRHSSLRSDVDDVTLLLMYLFHCLKSRGVVLVGHSTGAQVACATCERLGSRPPCDEPPVLGVVLQGAVSDREFFFALDPDASRESLESARRVLAEEAEAVGDDPSRKWGRPEPTVLLGGVATRATRAVALLERLGEEDFFSRDLTVEEMRERTAVGWLGGGGGGGGSGAGGRSPPQREVLVLASGADEYALPLLRTDAERGSKRVAERKRQQVEEHARRVAEAAGPNARAAVVAGAPHNGLRKEKQVVEEIVALLRRVVVEM